MYARALVTGEIEATNKSKHNSWGRSKEEAIASMDNAEMIYLQQKDIDRISKKIEDFEKKLEDVKRFGVRENEKKLLIKQIEKLKEQKNISLLKKEKEFLESMT